MSTTNFEDAALEIASKLENLGVKVPRECLNPGVYIGFIKGYEFAEKEIAKLKEELNRANYLLGVL